MIQVSEANRLATQLTEWRRYLHEHPELSFKEVNTSRFVADQLSQIEGIEMQTGIAKTGVVGTLSAGEGPTFAIRADMDALPVHEVEDHACRSQVAGVMHACGHDAHTAILLGVSRLLADKFKTGELQGTVKLIFQPAEETPDERGMTGAGYLVHEGILDDVDGAIALHMCPWKKPGEVLIHDGYSMANVDVFSASLLGRGGHGAYPQQGIDPIWMLGPILQAIHGIVPRRISPLEPAVISVGKVQGGEISNVIPGNVDLEGTMRSYSPATRETLITELEQALAVTRSLGGDYTFELTRGEPALCNDAAVNQKIEASIRSLYPDFSIEQNPFGLGGEDFGYVAEKIPAAMFFLGCNLSDGKERGLHSPAFAVDEACLPSGAAILAETAARYLTNDSEVEEDGS